MSTHKLPGEFDGILIASGESRPVMSKPAEFKAARVFVDRVMCELGFDDRDRAEFVADWIVNFAERYGARSAQPAFFLQSEQGPACSWCGVIWPLCGHHHMSEEVSDEEEEVNGE